MGRWTQYDEDSYRLPEGFKRVGYDSDRQVYIFKDGGGATWEGREGEEFGEMKKVSGGSGRSRTSNDDVEYNAGGRRSDGYRPLAMDPNQSVSNSARTGAYRTLFPFFLIIVVVLLLVFRAVSPSTEPAQPPCAHPDKTVKRFVRSGDSCWSICENNWGGKDTNKCLEALIEENKPRGLDCSKLSIGAEICVPEPPAQ
ncbi:hypothetical protein V5O48_010349 [Marasmius crinis-equi]|uniref:LysM domain-containing protein n=1 Tax=Marasmius crinis-equi TaxID=585013 RepID=A0ABR3F8P0_9AGAR